MGLLYVRTGNDGTDPAYQVDDLGIEIPTGASWTLLSASSPADPEGNSGLFNSREIRDSKDLYDAITGGQLEWSKDGAAEETGGSYTADYMMMQDFTDDELDLSNGRLIAPQGTSIPGTGSEGDLFWKTDTEELYVYDGSSYLLIANNAGTNNDHGGLDGLADDDHTQYHNDARGDARYFQQTEFVDTSAGAGDAGKPIKLDSNGKVNDNMLDLDGTETVLARVTGSTYFNLQDLQDLFHSAGWISGGTITDAGGNTIDVTAGTGLIRDVAGGTETLFWADWPANLGLSVPSDTVRYVGVEWNSGTPQVVVRSAYNWDLYTEFPLGVVVNEGGTIHVCDGKHAVGDHASTMIQRLYETMPLKRDERTAGLIISETGTRNIAVTAGALWERLTRFSVSAIDTSAADTFDSYYRDGGGGHTKTTSVTQWPNAQYDDGSGTLQTMTATYFANLWFYLTPAGDLIMMYGTNEYANQANAELESPPSDVPDRIEECAILIGRVVFQESAGTAALVESVFTETFSGSGATDHGSLSGLADDDHSQYPLVTGNAARNAITGTFDFSSGRLILPQATDVPGTFTSPVEGELGWDTDDDELLVYDGTSWVTFAGTIDHGNLLGLLDDDHPQYAHVQQNEVISGMWTFDPSTSTDPSFVITPDTVTPTTNVAGGAVTFRDDVLYIYDDTRTKFLSVDRQHVLAHKKGAAKNIYLRVGDGIASSQTGIRMIRNATIVGLAAQTDTSETWTLEVRKNGAAAVIASLAITAAQGDQDTTIDVNVDQGDELQFYANVPSGNVQSPVVTVQLASRLS